MVINHVPVSFSVAFNDVLSSSFKSYSVMVNPPLLPSLMETNYIKAKSFSQLADVTTISLLTIMLQ